MTREELFDKLKAGARWDVGVSINRSNSLPLDANSIFESYEIASTYASKNKEAIAALGLLDNAYIGQILTVVENNAVKIYVIDNNQKLQPVGNADGLTITTDDNGNFVLYGFEEAVTGTYPRVAERTVGEGDEATVEKYIEWVDLEIPAVTEGTYINVTTNDNGDYVVTHENAPTLAKNDADTEGSRFVSEITRDDQGHITGYKTEIVNIPDVSLDQLTIDRNATGAIEIKGAETAQPDTDKGLLPQLIKDDQGNKKLQWVTIDHAIEGATKDTITIGDGTSIQDKANDTSADHVLEIKGVRDTSNAGKILSTDGQGNVTWIDDQNTAHTHALGQGLSFEDNSATGGIDGVVTIKHNNAPTTGTNATNKGTGTGRTYVTDVLVDAMGHIAGVKTATETVVNTDTDTKTQVASGDDYIVVTPDPTEFTTGELNTFTISIDEDKLIELIGHSTTAAMEFKGATAVLPSDANTNDGDMYKVVGETALVVAADKDAQGAGFTAKAGDAIVAKVTGEGEAKAVTWYYIPSANEQDTWRPVQVNGAAIADSNTLNLKAGTLITLSESNGTVTINFNQNGLTVTRANLDDSINQSLDAANNAVEKDRLVEYITDKPWTSENYDFPVTTEIPEYSGTPVGGNYYLTETEYLLKPETHYELTLSYTDGSATETYYATSGSFVENGEGQDIMLTFSVQEGALVFRSGTQSGHDYTEVWYQASNGGFIELTGDYAKFVDATMVLHCESVYDLGIEKGAQVNVIDSVNGAHFTIDETKNLALNTELANKIDSALQPVEDAVAGHYAMFNENGEVIDGGHIAGFTDDDIIPCPPDTGNGHLGSGFTFGFAEHIPCPDNNSGLPGETPASQNPVLRVSIAGDEDYINVTRVYNDANEVGGNGTELGDQYAEAIGQITLSDTVKASLAKADTAVQEITTIDTSVDHTHGTETNCGGLKVTQNKDSEGEDIIGSVNIEIDDSITFILNCGSAADLL